MRTLFLILFTISLFSQMSVAADLPPLKMVVIGATWCPPCKVFERSLVAAGLAPNVAFFHKAVVPPLYTSLKIDDVMTPVEILMFNQDLMTQNEIMANDTTFGIGGGYPSIFIYRDNNLVLSHTGIINLSDIQGWFDIKNLDDLLFNGNVDKIEKSFADTKIFSEVGQRLRGQRAVVLTLGASEGPEYNGASITRTLSLAQENLLNATSVNKTNLISFYGLGPDTDTSAMIAPADGAKAAVYAPRKPDLVDYPDKQSSLLSVVAAVRAANVKKMLIVVKGHGGEQGIALWPEAVLNRKTFNGMIKYSGAQTIMISGTCHSGIFQNSGQCGFYAARPELESSGCGTSEFRAPDDYVSGFTDALNHDRDVTFAAAHWSVYNSTDGDTAFTDIDALADLVARDELFKKHFGLMGFGPAADLYKYLIPLEQAAYQKSWQDLGFKKGTQLAGANTAVDYNDMDRQEFMRLLGYDGDLPDDPVGNHIKYKTGRQPAQTTGEVEAYKARRFIQLLRRATLRQIVKEAKPGSEAYAQTLGALDTCENQSIREFVR